MNNNPFAQGKIQHSQHFIAKVKSSMGTSKIPENSTFINVHC